jgi:DNA-binding transcriptional LysR family regulator
MRAEDDHALFETDIGVGVTRVRINTPLEHRAWDVNRAGKPGLLAIRKGAVKPEALGRETLLVREANSSTRQIAERAFSNAGVQVERVWELDSSEAIKRAAREGLGVAFLSRYAVAEEVERGELESFRLAGRPPIDRQLYVARLARRPLSPSERGFIATLTRCCAKSADFAAACVG